MCLFTVSHACIIRCVPHILLLKFASDWGFKVRAVGHKILCTKIQLNACVYHMPGQLAVDETCNIDATCKALYLLNFFHLDWKVKFIGLVYCGPALYNRYCTQSSPSDYVFEMKIKGWGHIFFWTKILLNACVYVSSCLGDWMWNILVPQILHRFL